MNTVKLSRQKSSSMMPNPRLKVIKIYTKIRMPAGNTQVVVAKVSQYSVFRSRPQHAARTFKRRLRLVYIECENKTSELYLELDLCDYATHD